MKAKDLRAKQPKDLGEELLKLRREQFNLRMARATGHMGRGRIDPVDSARSAWR
jgi:large subunit ribosomal protein L29